MEANLAPDQAVAESRDGRTLRIVIVWGVRFLGEILAATLELDPEVSVVGQCADLSEAAALSDSGQADVVLFDARIPDAAAVVRRVIEVYPALRVVASGVRETEDDIVAWAEAGVVGYVPRTAALADLVRLIMDIHSGEQVCAGKVATGLLRHIALSARRGADRGAAVAAPALTKRERQVAELIRSGLSDKEVARQLNISLATTKSHVHNLLGKLNARRRSEVAGSLRGYEQHPQ